MYLILVTIFLVTFFYYLYYKSDNRRKRKFLEKFPGPRKLPLVGNAFDIKTTEDILPYAQELHGKYNIAYIRMGPTVHALVMVEPKSYEFILNSSIIIEKSRAYSFLDRWLGSGLLTAGGSKWRKHRKILTPAFHFKILEEFVEVFDKFGKILIKKLNQEVGKDSVDVYPYISLCTLDIICETAMGVSINAQTNTNSEYVKSVKEMCRIVIERSKSVLKLNPFIYRLSRDYRKEIKSLKVLHGFTENVIKQKKEELRKRAEDVDEISKNEFGIKKKLAFLDLLLQVKESDGRPALNDTEIREEVDTFMFRGHDTTATAISFIMYCLANNAHVQDKAAQEIKVLLGDDDDRVLTYQDLQSMKYLEMVIKESLRLYPSVPMIGRYTLEDTMYEGKTIPKGTNIGINIYGIHRDAKIFPDPEKFNPERFDDMTDKSPYSYIPFSAGPRNCIGIQQFAMFEMKATVAKILKYFELLPVIPEHKIILQNEVVLKSKNGICIRLKHRK